MKEFTVSESIIMWAFRYALGRKTYVVEEVANCLKENWEKIADHTKICIKEEITAAIALGHAGMDCDIKNWKQILEL